MIMKKLISLFLSLIIMLSMPITASAVEVTKEEIKAKSAVLMCVDTGDVLYANNEYEHLSPASVTKIMTILLVLEAIDGGKIKLTDKVTASANAVSKGGSQIWLEVGEVMTVEELLKAVVVASANDACTALSEFIAGSASGFVDMMNKRANELGLENTNFENCTGLDDDTKNHYSCAYDLAVISCEVMKHKLVTDYTTIWLDSLRGGKTELNNTNKLVNYFNGITGLKTGTTSNAGFCVSATACRDGMNLVAVVLGSDTSNDRFDTAAYLLEYGFANYQVVSPKIDEKQIKNVIVRNGEEKYIKPVADKTAKTCIEKTGGEISYKYETVKEVKAPVKKGSELGKITVMADKKAIGEIKLIADRDINKTTLKSIMLKLFIKI